MTRIYFYRTLVVIGMISTSCLCARTRYQHFVVKNSSNHEVKVSITTDVKQNKPINVGAGQSTPPQKPNKTVGCITKIVATDESHGRDKFNPAEEELPKSKGGCPDITIDVSSSEFNNSLDINWYSLTRR